MVLRLYKNGLMKTLPVFAELNYMDMMPLRVRSIIPSFAHSLCFDKSIWQLEEPDEGCIRPSNDVFCFLAGDSRANEQTVTPNSSKSFILPLFPDPGNDAHTLCEGTQPNRQRADQDQPTLG